ncbi:hypothetical protein [Labilibacter marinus]|uniref:hypothetical protein n=1 Tax=Labilibacter marinus TaxID=1477105 RepID=UPI0018E92516|nr:hypothetical protein [Labilibacter marinus]
MQDLFFELYKAGTEQEVEDVITKHPEIFNQKKNWKPLGGSETTYGVIENQQASPIAALIEKITNSIDATLTKRCLEENIDPESKDSPRSMTEAIERFYPKHKDWDLKTVRRKQSEEIQIIADGSPRNTSVIIYDNGEGQHPEQFEDSFLSLLRGNKNKIHFVQGKYNMGGSGGIVFCGKKSYQLIASKRYDNSGKFGFTLVREHPFSKQDQLEKKNTWYEYLVINSKIPAFQITELDLNLHGREFKTGSIIKLYSYQFPPGIYGFAQELNQSINEFLFQPALPILTVETKKRYPNNKVLELDLFGLKRRLEAEKEEYLEEYWSNEYKEENIGKTRVTSYVFKTKVKDNDVKKTKENIQKRYFKNNMSVLFSMNGQVHGHFTSEFISRSLKMNLLKNHLLIHVDCTHMDYSFRKELFMASRDRLKNGDETSALRKFLSKKLTQKDGRLAEIEKMRKNAFSTDSNDAKDLLKNFTKSLPMNSDLLKLLDQTFKLEQKKEKPKAEKNKQAKTHKEKEPFNPQRFPSFFKLNAKNDGEKEVASIPLGGEKTMSFDTDVENHYFDRVEEPGEMKIALLNFKKENETSGGDRAGISDIEDIFNVDKRSPKDGNIKIGLNPLKSAPLEVGDMCQIKVTLNGTGEEFDQVFWVKIADKEQPKEKAPDEDKVSEENLGLPEFQLAYKEPNENQGSWDDVAAMGEEIDHQVVMIPVASGDALEKVIINMDSGVILNYKSKNKNITQEQLTVADNKYISSVYFHTLFLYTITKKQKYSLIRVDENNQEQSVDIADYLKDVFQSYYSEFILNFGGMEELMQGLSE